MTVSADYLVLGSVYIVDHVIPFWRVVNCVSVLALL